ncbi:MAG: bifunctional 4-hydroxy-2-oxoglutarate aldolase/2-dehydro-3-deoxy-phosphogluconate aldolase [Anaerolineae bacterium]|nr:bifunctional 4-hydroxy-2-oxoglutarate aldolase/2-dehydro-3-deoxy-phosphogluconate aldolase [Thermoflexales bacterium]MDW8406903.1 bifunctional 4-hydroxy-2-oxoglutarate aldolase/2-dehydro-3-deoxy-phosphogluconate aldolase [Anaerolineae bacterium]
MLPIESRLRRMFAEQIVAIIRANSPERALDAAHTLIRAGFKLIEITLTIPGAPEVIKALADSAPAEVMIGAGTVMSAVGARDCITQGAQFIVSPICETDIIRPCREAGVVAIPAGLSATEIVHAWRLGAHVVKVFPVGTVGGPAYIKALRGPLPDIPLWVSGMVIPAQAPEYTRAGAQLVGLGSDQLLPAHLVEAGDWEEIATHAHAVLLTAKGIREI